MLLLMPVLFFFIPQISHAQQKPVIHEASIYFDEEEKFLSSPVNVLADPVTDEIYVVSQSRVLIYTNDLFPLYTIGKSRGVTSPQGMAVDRDGNLYVSQAPTMQEKNSRYRISVFNACLQWERDIFVKDPGGEKPFTPNRLAVDGKGNLYVAGSFYPGVLVLDKQGQKIDMMVPVEKEKKPAINDVKVGENGNIYLLSAEMGRVYVYDENRQFLFQFGAKGGSTGLMSRPVGVGTDPLRERFYVVDFMRHTVLAFDYNGKYLFEFGGLGAGPGWLQYPWDIAVDKSGRVFIADTFNNRVEVFKPSGQ